MPRQAYYVESQSFHEKNALFEKLGISDAHDLKFLDHDQRKTLLSFLKLIPAKKVQRLFENKRADY